ncbi:MAG: choline dehydrogenase [Bacteroidota bacterium]
MNQTFDYIIIGAGSAGCVMASRLSESGQYTVLVLEAGGKDKHQNVQTPAAFPKLFKSKRDYAFHTTAQETMKNRKMYLPRGKMLGGSSSINAMIYIRGNKQDYNEWAKMGNPGWAYEEVLPYFKKSQHQEVFDNMYHGKEGPLHVSNRNYTNPLSEVFIQAGEELGYPRNEDFNGENQEGFGMYQVTHRNGARCSAADAFLHPASSRSNVQVEIHARVERIVFENGQATGVIYHQKGQRIEANVNKEVILSAGAYNSPQILMLSGIGDREELSKHGIEVIHHLPGVGKNLQDHLVFFAIFNSNYKQTLDSAENFPVVFKNLFNYLVRKQGPFASNVGEAGAFVYSSKNQPSPDIQFHFGPVYFISHGFGNPPKGNGYSIGGKILNPTSRGSVTLASGNFQEDPLIDHNYMSTEDDVQRAIWGYKLAAKLGLTKAFAPYHTGFHLPATNITDDQAIVDFIRETGETLYHPTSTCKMGNDPMAVVNHKLSVHGLQGLRIVDASIMPNVTRGNTNAPTIMIAEKAADMVLNAQQTESYQLQEES